MNFEELKQIAQGYSKLLMSKVNLTSQEENELSAKRMNICKGCEALNNNTCTVCGCYMPAKTKLKDVKCPENYW